MLSLSLVFISFSISFSLYRGMQQTKGGPVGEAYFFLLAKQNAQNE